ncbi:hypothetical protein SO802_029695 [Lithocarpus litseifolius]|uniref:Peptidase M3A/M3B catalytic domain-containing protein n=1 Tax=Lithocarpus litseifolius TaxID=425828 RepID=A0AAW2BVT5_9ROSI
MLTKVATLEEAKELLEKLCSAYYNVAVQELEYIKRFCKECDAQEADDLKFWDLRYWIKAVRDVSCTINEESMAAYLSLPTVLDGLFNLTKTLFGIRIEQVDHLALVWHDDVKFYFVKDSSHNPIAYFYLDPYA